MKSKKLSDAAETPPGEADEKGEEEENKGEAEDEQTESREEEKGSREGGEHMDIDDCEVCPGAEATFQHLRWIECVHCLDYHRSLHPYYKNIDCVHLSNNRDTAEWQWWW